MDLVKSNLQKLTVNFVGLTRNDTMEGKAYLVAPMIMLLEGVHQGSNGPLYYPAEELAKTPSVWNHKPIVVYHPVLNGQGVSACDPQILTNRKVGLIMNTTFKDGKLKAEAWIDTERAAIVDNRIIDSVTKNQMMELSTGVFTDNENIPGEWNGEKYDAIARNYRPDHLALLPDIKGACSIEDGAGFLRLNAENKSILINLSEMGEDVVNFFAKDDSYLQAVAEKFSKMIVNEMSHEDIRKLLYGILTAKKTEAYIEDVYENYFIYDSAGKYYKQEFKLVKEVITFVGLPQEMIKVSEYKLKINSINSKGKKMEKEKLVNDLIANTSTLWAEADKEALLAMDEAVLSKMLPIANEVKKEEVKVEPVANAEVKPLSIEEFLSKQVPAEMRPMLTNGYATYKANKKKLVDEIVANAKNSFTLEQLNAKEVDELFTIAKLARMVEPVKNNEVFDYSGQGDPVIINTSKQEPMPLPTMTFGKKQ